MGLRLGMNWPGEVIHSLASASCVAFVLASLFAINIHNITFFFNIQYYHSVMVTHLPFI